MREIINNIKYVAIGSAMLVPGVSAASEDLSEAKQLLLLFKEQQKQIALQEEQLKTQKQQVEKLLKQVSALQVADKAAAKKLSKIRPAAGTPAKKKPTPPPPENPSVVGVDRKPKERTRPPKVEAVKGGGGVLLGKGKAVVESSIEYSRSSALLVAIEGFTIIPALNIGSFEITAVDRDTVVTSVAGRLGLTKRLEVEARVPWVYRSDSTLSRVVGTGTSTENLSNVDGNNLGDIEVGARYQLTDGKNGMPFLVGGLRFKSHTGKDPFEVATDPTTGLQTELPTGSGFYALQPSITAILPSDPVVLYGSLGYLYNMSRDFGGTIGEIDPGDSISASMGMGFSVNEKVSFSLGYSHSYVFETTQNGATIPNSDPLHVGSLSTGFSYRVNNKTSLNMNIDAGLTDDAPDVRLLFRVPVSLDLF